VNVAWINSLGHIFGGFWRESVKSLQFFCQTLPITHFIGQRKLLFWSKLATHGNSFLFASRAKRFYAVASGYGISSISVSVSHIVCRMGQVN